MIELIGRRGRANLYLVTAVCKMIPILANQRRKREKFNCRQCCDCLYRRGLYQTRDRFRKNFDPFLV